MPSSLYLYMYVCVQLEKIGDSSQTFTMSVTMMLVMLVMNIHVCNNDVGYVGHEYS